MYSKPEEVDQHLQREYMNAFLIRNVSQAGARRPGASRGCLSIFLIRYVFQTRSIPKAPERVYECSPYEICLRCGNRPGAITEEDGRIYHFCRDRVFDREPGSTWVLLNSFPIPRAPTRSDHYVDKVAEDFECYPTSP